MLDDENRKFHVVMNHEEQYSVWPSDRDVPVGWNAVGTSDSMAECLDYIDRTWSDMRPLSLRRKMETDQAGAGAAEN